MSRNGIIKGAPSIRVLITPKGVSPNRRLVCMPPPASLRRFGSRPFRQNDARGCCRDALSFCSYLIRKGLRSIRTVISAFVFRIQRQFYARSLPCKKQRKAEHWRNGAATLQRPNSSLLGSHSVTPNPPTAVCFVASFGSCIPDAGSSRRSQSDSYSVSKTSAPIL